MTSFEQFVPENLRIREELKRIDRKAALAEVSRGTRFDLVVVGAGIHGALFARIAALEGLKTLLIDRNDFCAETSGRSSKMAHGGLRYLYLWDFRQVFESLRARSDLLHAAPHLVKPWPFMVPFRTSEHWLRELQVRLGVGLYNALAWVATRLGSGSFGGSFSDTFLRNDTAILPLGDFRGSTRFVDGILQDTALTLEQVIAAAQEGAWCANYVQLDSWHHTDSNSVVCGLTDTLTGARHEIQAGAVVNCAGPWAAHLGQLLRRENLPVRFSRGSHLLFSRKWDLPALCMPLFANNRFYFVWPHPGGTLVGTTEREVSAPVSDPMPTADEVEEILSALQKDLPQSGLSRETLYYAYSGLRILPLRDSHSQATAKLSRRHVWKETSATLSLLGGKFTSAAWTAGEGFKRLIQKSSLPAWKGTVSQRLLPGGWHYQERGTIFRAEAQKQNIAAPIIDRIVARLGGRAVDLMNYPNWAELLGGEILSSEIRLGIEAEGACTIEDLMQRRLGVEYLPGAGLAALNEIVVYIETHKLLPLSSEALQLQAENYRNRIATMRALLRVS